MEFLKIVLLAVLAAVLYGVLQDQVTTRVCVEYFTLGHPPVFATDDPTLLALGWGVIATWWVGVLLGVPLACCARLGSRPPLTAAQLVVPIGIQLVSVAAIALAAGFAGYAAARSGAVVLIGELADRVPRERHVLFIADLWAHLAAYVSGGLTGLVVCRAAWVKRGRLAAAGGSGNAG
jgi:hypothetical protein